MPEQGHDQPPVAPARQRQRFAEWPMTAVLVGVAVGLAIVGTDRFRTGTVVIAGATLLGAVLRAGLPERRAGLLVVRSRVVDVLTLLIMGSSLLVLAIVVPGP